VTPPLPPSHDEAAAAPDDTTGRDSRAVFLPPGAELKIVRSDDTRLADLATTLEQPLRRRLLTLLQADGRAVRAVHLEEDLQHAEALVDELRRHLAAAERQVDVVRTALAVDQVDVDGLRARLAIRVGPPAYRASTSTAHPGVVEVPRGRDR